MKNFSKYVEENKVNDKISFENLPKKIVEKLKNLEGKYITECCCNCVSNYSEPCSCGCEEPQIIWFQSQSQIVNILKSDIRVQDIYNIHTQFDNKYRFQSNTPSEAQEILYFKERNYLDNTLFNRYINNEKLYKFIKELCSDFKLGYPTVLDRADNKLQVFFNINLGSNGVENSIKSSLEKVVKILEGLEDRKEITWSQVLDIAIDNLDDVYTFLVTIEIDTTKFENKEPQVLDIINKEEDKEEK